MSSKWHETLMEKETQFWAWEEKYGHDEAIEVAAEEWGVSTYKVKQLIKEWEDLLWQ